MTIAEQIRSIEFGQTLKLPEKHWQAVYSAARRAGIRITLRRVGDQIHIWRIEQ